MEYGTRQKRNSELTRQNVGTGSKARLLSGSHYTPSRRSGLADIEDKLNPRDKSQSQERNARIMNIYATLDSIGPSAANQSQTKFKPKFEQAPLSKKSSILEGTNISNSFNFYYKKKGATPEPSKVKSEYFGKILGNEMGKSNNSQDSSSVKINQILKFHSKTPQSSLRYNKNSHQHTPSNVGLKRDIFESELNKSSVESRPLQAETGSTVSKGIGTLSTKSIPPVKDLPSQLQSSSKDRILNSLNQTRERLNRSSDNISEDLHDFKPNYHSNISDLLKKKSISSLDAKSKLFQGHSHGTYTNTLLKPEISYFERIISRDYLLITPQTGNLKDTAFSLFIEDCKEQVQLLNVIENSYHQNEVIKAPLTTLPMSLKTRCIFVDLDETLVRTEKEVPGKKYDDVVSIRTIEGDIEASLNLFSMWEFFIGHT